MRIRCLSERVEAAASLHDIIMDTSEGLTQVAPGVMMFYGVKRDFVFIHFGQGRQQKYLALIGEHVTIEPYAN